MFLNNFWNQFGYGGFNSNLDDMLKKPALTVEDILDTDTIMTDLRGQGATKLAKFLVEKPEFLKKFIDYVTILPNEEDSQEAQFKYPFVASEILNLNMNAVVEYLFKPEAEEQNEGSQKDSVGSAEQSFDDNNDLQEEVPVQTEATELNSANVTESAGAQPGQTKAAGEEGETTGQQKKQGGENNNQKPSEENTEQTEDNQESNTEGSTKNEQEAKGAPIQEIEKEKIVEQKITGSLLLNQILDFFKEPKPLNPTLTGYFFQLFQTLISQYGKLIKFLVTEQKQEEFIASLINHIDNRSVSQIIKMLFSMEGIESDTPEEVREFQKILVNALKNIIDKSESTDDLEGVDIIISEFLSNQPSYENNSELNKFFISADFIISLAEKIKALGQSKENYSKAVYPLNILNNVVQVILNYNQKRKDIDLEEEEQNNIQEFNPEQLVEFFKYLQEFVIILEKYTQNPEERTFSNKQMVLQLGAPNLQIVELFLKVFKLQIEASYPIIIQSGFLKIIPNMLVKFKWNNIFHTYVERFYSDILSDQIEILLDHIIHETNLIQVFMETITNEHENKQGRSGNFGYFFVLYKQFKAFFREKDFGEEHLKKSSFNTEWSNLQEIAKSIQKYEDFKLGVQDPKDPQDNNSEEEKSADEEQKIQEEDFDEDAQQASGEDNQECLEDQKLPNQTAATEDAEFIKSSYFKSNYFGKLELEDLLSDLEL